MKQQLIVVFDAPDIQDVQRIIEETALGGPKYNSPKGLVPLVVSVKADAEEMFEALYLTRADYIMTAIGMESENVFSMGEVSQSLFFGKPAKATGKKKPVVVAINYQVELRNALDREDYEEASIVRDIIAGTKKLKDLKTYRNGKKAATV